MATPFAFSRSGLQDVWRTFKNWRAGRRCPSCGRYSPRWCNYFDWYSDGTPEHPTGSNCTWDQIGRPSNGR